MKMKMKRNPLNVLYSFVMLLFIAVSAFAQNERKVAVFDPIGTVDKVLLEVVREEISSVVVNRSGYTVLERQLTNKVLEENKFQESGLVDNEQVSEIGRLVGADYVFVTTISALGTNFYISCKMIEVATARIDKQFTGTSTDGMNDIPQTTQYIVRRLFGEDVRQPVANRTQPSTTQKDAPVANRQSNVLNEYSYGFLTAKGKNVFSSSTGKALNHDEMRALLVNTDALYYYNKGVKKRKNGNIMIAIGCGFLGVGAILEIVAPTSYLIEPGIGAFGGGVGFCAFAIPGFAMNGGAKKNIRKAVELYNGSGQVYSEPPPAFQIDFGITSSGGIGFVMNF